MKFPRVSRLDSLDAMHILGVGVVIFGIWQLNHAAAWIAGGLALIFYSFLVSAGRRHIEP